MRRLASKQLARRLYTAKLLPGRLEAPHTGGAPPAGKARLYRVRAPHAGLPLRRTMCYIYSKAIRRRHKRRLTLAEQGSRDNKFNAAVGGAPISSARRRTRGAAASAYDAEV